MPLGAGGRKTQILLALAAVYFIWGSTYLAIRFALESLPPLLMASARFTLAGGIMLAVLIARGVERPSRHQLRSAMIVGTMLLFVGNGFVCWSQQRVPSGIAALVISCVPIFMAVMDAVRPGGRRPAPWAMLGIATGFAGLVLLIGPAQGMSAVDRVGAAGLMIGSLSWSAGSLFARSAPLPANPLLGIAIQMLTAGFLLMIAGLAFGESARVHLGALTPRAIASVLYLAVFGSIVAFSCYVWLLKHTTVSVASTYAFVNPIVAMLLGWGFAGETLGGRTLVAAAIVSAGVAMITLGRPVARK